MTSKDDLVNIIKEWIEIDDKIKDIQNNFKQLKNQKKILTQSLLSIMKENEIDCFDMNSGKIIFCKNKTKVPLNKKTLLDNLEKYFHGNDSIDVNDVKDFLLDHREIRLHEVIKRKL